MKTQFKNNAIFVIALVAILTIISNFSASKLLTNYLITLVFAVIYYVLSAIITLYLEEKANKTHKEEWRENKEYRDKYK